MQVKRKGDPLSKSSAVSPEAKKQVEFVRNELAKRVPNAKPSEDFLVKVASTYSLSNKNPRVLDSAAKQLKK